MGRTCRQANESTLAAHSWVIERLFAGMTCDQLVGGAYIIEGETPCNVLKIRKTCPVACDACNECSDLSNTGFSGVYSSCSGLAEVFSCTGTSDNDALLQRLCAATCKTGACGTTTTPAPPPPTCASGEYVAAGACKAKRVSCGPGALFAPGSHAEKTADDTTCTPCQDGFYLNFPASAADTCEAKAAKESCPAGPFDGGKIKAAVGGFIYFVNSSTRAPCGAHVRMRKRNRSGRHSWIVGRLFPGHIFFAGNNAEKTMDDTECNVITTTTTQTTTTTTTTKVYAARRLAQTPCDGGTIADGRARLLDDP